MLNAANPNGQYFICLETMLNTTSFYNFLLYSTHKVS